MSHTVHMHNTPPQVHTSTPGGIMDRLKTDNQISMTNISSIPPVNQTTTNQVTLPHEYSQQDLHHHPQPFQPHHHVHSPHAGNFNKAQVIPQSLPNQNRQINVNPSQNQPQSQRIDNQMPEIRKYKKKFSSDINSAVIISMKFSRINNI